MLSLRLSVKLPRNLRLLFIGSRLLGMLVVENLNGGSVRRQANW